MDIRVVEKIPMWMSHASQPSAKMDTAVTILLILSLGRVTVPKLERKPRSAPLQIMLDY